MFGKPNSKALLASTAIELFRERGYGNVTISDICARAGVTRNAFYYNFSSKDELLVYQGEDYIFRQEETAARLASIRSPLGRLFYVTDEVQRRYLEMGVDLTRQFLKVGLDGKLQDLSRSPTSRTYVIPLLRTCQEEGYIRNPLPPERLEFLISRLMFGILMSWCASPEIDLMAEQRYAMAALLEVKEDCYGEIMGAQ